MEPREQMLWDRQQALHEAMMEQWAAERQVGVAFAGLRAKPCGVVRCDARVPTRARAASRMAVVAHAHAC
jgi:hypothetical protein